jgi:hypothetical protein
MRRRRRGDAQSQKVSDLVDYPVRPRLIDAAYFAQATREAGVSAIVNTSQISARREAKRHAARLGMTVKPPAGGRQIRGCAWWIAENRRLRR